MHTAPQCSSSKLNPQTTPDRTGIDMIFALLISLAFNFLAIYTLTRRDSKADVTYFIVARVRIRTHSGWQVQYFRGSWDSKCVTSLDQVRVLEEAIKKHIVEDIPALLIPLSNKDTHSVQIINIQRMPL